MSQIFGNVMKLFEKSLIGKTLRLTMNESYKLFYNATPQLLHYDTNQISY